MVQINVDRGLAIDMILSQILRENGLHILKVHNGTITHYGKLEKVSRDPWVTEALETLQPDSKRSKGTKSSET